MSDDLFLDAHHAAEKAYEAVMEGEIEGTGCACGTCTVRELLTAAWPYLKQAALEGYE